VVPSFVLVSLILLGFAFGIFVFTYGREGYNRWRESRLLKQAHEMLRRGDLDGADHAARHALEIHLDSLPAYHVLAEITEKKNSAETVAWRAQIAKLQDRFGLSRIVVVADRGMVTKANIELLAEADGVGWITALKAPTIKKLARSGIFQPSLFDEQNLGEITDVEEFPGERLVVCRNPLVGAQRARTREELLAATETDLAQIAHRVEHGTLLGADQIGLAVGPALKRFRMKKHFQITITDTTFTYTRDTAGIAAEAALDGFYILRTSLTETDLTAGDVVRAYKNLEQAERAFGSLKGPELQIRPIHHHLETRVRAHVLICMLAYYLTWHLKAAWKPLLFTDEHRPVSPDPVAKAVRSPAAQQKAQTKRTSSGQPAHSYRTLLTELATQTRNTTRLHGHTTTFEKLTQPTALQAEALDLAAHAPVVVDR
jgi:hypothetical protein